MAQYGKSDQMHTHIGGINSTYKEAKMLITCAKPIAEVESSYELVIELSKWTDGGLAKIAMILADLMEYGHSYFQSDYSTPWQDEFLAYTTESQPRYSVIAIEGGYRVERVF